MSANIHLSGAVGVAEGDATDDERLVRWGETERSAVRLQRPAAVMALGVQEKEVQNGQDRRAARGGAAWMGRIHTSSVFAQRKSLPAQDTVLRLVERTATRNKTDGLVFAF